MTTHRGDRALQGAPSNCARRFAPRRRQHKAISSKRRPDSTTNIQTFRRRQIADDRATGRPRRRRCVAVPGHATLPTNQVFDSIRR